MLLGMIIIDDSNDTPYYGQMSCGQKSLRPLKTLHSIFFGQSLKNKATKSQTFVVMSYVEWCMVILVLIIISSIIIILSSILVEHNAF